MFFVLIGVTLLVASCQAIPTPMYDNPDAGNTPLKIGLVLPIHRPSPTMKHAYDVTTACGDLDETQMLQATFFISMIEAINRRDDFLPGVKLGYSIIDSCGLSNVAIVRASTWNMEDNSTSRDSPVLVVGGYNSRVSLPLTMYLELYDIPLIDSGATLGDLSDRRRYTLYARTSPSDKHQTTAIADVAKLLGQECVHVIYSEGLYGEMGADDLRLRLAERHICIASDQMAPTLITSQSSNDFSDIVNTMRQNSTAKTVICFCEDSTLEALLAAIKRERGMAGKTADGDVPRFKLMGGDYWSHELRIRDFEDVAEGATTVTMGLPPNATTSIAFNAEKVVDALNTSNANPWLVEWFENKFRCSFTNPYAMPCDLTTMLLADEDLPVNPEAELLYAAILAGAQGLHTLMAAGCPGGKGFAKPECIAYAKTHAKELYKNIIAQTIDMAEFGHPPFKFDEFGEGLPRYTFSTIQREVVETDYYGEPSYDYVPMAVWTKDAEMETFDDVVAKCKVWPRTNEAVTSTCTCPA